ncbi:MAG TPA: hypothetical protein DD733_00130 [Clostridiales bacterium]|nr:hypothetical protein [Clostridiales bacterium]
MTNLNYSNGSGKMGDTDGPAYAVYSKKGYNKASVDIKLSQIELNNIRKSDGKFVNAYLFLGIDIFDDGGNWVNCLDAGLCYSGTEGAWHAFYNLYTASEGTPTWYESHTLLEYDRDYRLLLDSSLKDGRASLTIFDITENKIADSIEFEAAYSFSDGSNTSYLQNYALDYPDDVKFNTDGKYTDDDFVEITLYNTDENLYLKNICITDAKLYDSNNEITWSEERSQNRSMWPDMNISIDYEVVSVWKNSFDSSYTVSLNMNRN